jgi:hypothetical protein
MTRSPQWLFGYARALHGLGHDKEAMQTLGQLHRQGVYARPTLELMRDLAFQTQQTEIGRQTERFLQEHFADNAPAGWSGEPGAVRRWA